MALFESCKTCTTPEALRKISSTVEGSLPALQGKAKRDLDAIQDSKTPPEIKDRIASSLTVTTLLRAQVEIVAARANAHTCPRPEDTCDRALFVMSALAAAMDAATHDIEQIRGQASPPAELPPSPEPPRPHGNDHE